MDKLTTLVLLFLLSGSAIVFAMEPVNVNTANKAALMEITGIGEKHVCETQGEFGYRELVINFIDQDPCPPNETLQWDNSLYVIETGGLRILHWGDNRQNPPPPDQRRLLPGVCAVGATTTRSVSRKQ